MEFCNNKIIDVASERGAIYLGVWDTLNVRQQKFDVSAWLDAYGDDGVLTVLNQRRTDELPYEVADVTLAGGVATWTFDTTDTAIVGEGKAALVYIRAGETIARTVPFPTFTAPTIGMTGVEPPDPWEAWYTRILEASAAAQASATAAAASAQDATQQAQKAETQATLAATARSQAVEARNDARSARDDAQTARDQAQLYAGDAADARDRAEAAQDAAEAAAAAVADVLPIETENIANGAVTTEKLADGAVSFEKLAPDTVDEIEGLADGAARGVVEEFSQSVIAPPYSEELTYEKGDYVTYQGLFFSATQDILTPEAWNNNHWRQLTVADVLPIETENIADGAVTTDKIAPSAVTEDKIAPRAVTSAKLGVAAVTALNIAAGAVSNEKIAGGAVSTAKLAAQAVTTDKIAGGAVTTDKIAPLAVSEAELAAAAVIGEKMADNAITFRKLSESNRNVIVLPFDRNSEYKTGDYVFYKSSNGAWIIRRALVDKAAGTGFISSNWSSPGNNDSSILEDIVSRIRALEEAAGIGG